MTGGPIIKGHLLLLIVITVVDQVLCATPTESPERHDSPPAITNFTSRYFRGNMHGFDLSVLNLILKVTQHAA